jgi:hypothetical protein
MGSNHRRLSRRFAVPLPRQLPAGPARLIDRAGELSLLDGLLTGAGRGPLLVVITGAPGMGKSAVALWWLHAHDGEFPDGQLHADLLVLPGRLRIASAFGLPMRNPPAFATVAAALAWCDAEQAGLLEAQKTATDLGLHAATWQFGDTLYGWISHRHDYAAWQALCEPAVTSKRACGDARAEVFCAIRLVSCHVARGDLAAATPVAERAVKTAWANGDRAGKAVPASTPGSAPWHQAAARTPSLTSPARWTAGGASPATGAPRRSSTASSAAPCPTSAGPARPTST